MIEHLVHEYKIHVMLEYMSKQYTNFEVHDNTDFNILGKFSHIFYVLESSEIQFIIGVDFFAKHGIVLDYETSVLRGKNFSVPFTAMNKTVSEILLVY